MAHASFHVGRHDYLPKTHVRMDLLRPTDTVTHCPYKGQAEYWSVAAGERVYADFAWSYPTPFPESEKIAGLVSFYNERIDLCVDGVLQERPRTKFSLTGGRSNPDASASG